MRISDWSSDVCSSDLLYVPQRDRYLGVLNRDFVYDQTRSKVLAAAAQNQVPVIDLAALFRKQPRAGDLYGTDSHFSERGAAMVARVIQERLQHRSTQSDAQTAGATEAEIGRAHV